MTEMTPEGRKTARTTIFGIAFATVLIVAVILVTVYSALRSGMQEGRTRDLVTDQVADLAALRLTGAVQIIEYIPDDPHPALHVQLERINPERWVVEGCSHPAVFTVSMAINPGAPYEERQYVILHEIEHSMHRVTTGDRIRVILPEKLPVQHQDGTLVSYRAKIEPPVQCGSGSLWEVEPQPFDVPSVVREGRLDGP